MTHGPVARSSFRAWEASLAQVAIGGVEEHREVRSALPGTLAGPAPSRNRAFQRRR